MILENICTPEKKLKAWGPGKWCDEPDIVRFEHAGLKCLIRRYVYNIEGFFIGTGHLNGYCILPKEHLLHGESDFKKFHDFDVHGGITFNDFDNFEPYEFMIGFDCAHAGDIIPSTEKIIKEEKEKFYLNNYGAEILERTKLIFEDTYKNIPYCIGECKRLAEQVQAIKKD